MPAAAAVVGGSLISGAMGASASRSAARSQAQSAEKASQAQLQATREGIGASATASAPWRNVGAAGLYQLADLLGIDAGQAMGMGPSAEYGSMPTAPGTGTGTQTGASGLNITKKTARNLFKQGGDWVWNPTSGQWGRPDANTPADATRLRPADLYPMQNYDDRGDNLYSLNDGQWSLNGSAGGQAGGLAPGQGIPSYFAARFGNSGVAQFGRYSGGRQNDAGGNAQSYSQSVGGGGTGGAGSNVPGANLIPGMPSPSRTKSADFGSLMKSFGIDDFEQEPGYQFRMDEGIRGLENSGAARGMQLSGSNIKALDRFNQDYASNEYGNAYNRYNTDQTNKYNRLANIAGLGQTSANQLGSQAQSAMQNYGNQVGQNIIGAGNARAAGQVGAANAWSGAISNGMNTYSQMNTLQNLFGGGGGGFAANAAANGVPSQMFAGM